MKMNMDLAEMNFKLALLLWLVNYSSAQVTNCDYYQYIQAGMSYSLYNPNYPRNYSGGQTCRWIFDCPPGYNCRLNCPTIIMPESQSCSMDRFMVSRTGDSQLAGAESYCGRGSLSIASVGQRITIGLMSNINSPGGTFRCQLTAELAAPTPSCRCGERRQNRIVGGEPTGVNEFKMMVGLADVRINQITCGAVLISNRHVLTAAHCVRNQSINVLAVVVGEHDVTTGDSPATRAYRIRNFIIHPLFTESNYDYDIAIVTTELQIEFNDRVGPACLPFKFRTYDFTGENVTALGWGTIFAGGPTSNVLLKVDLNVINQNVCSRSVSSLTNRQMCTFTPGKDACQYDSGGPLLYTDPATSLLFHVGIISYGRSCASNQPGVNTRVTALLDWIVANTQPMSSYCVK